MRFVGTVRTVAAAVAVLNGRHAPDGGGGGGGGGGETGKFGRRTRGGRRLLGRRYRDGQHDGGCGGGGRRSRRTGRHGRERAVRVSGRTTHVRVGYGRRRPRTFRGAGTSYRHAARLQGGPRRGNGRTTTPPPPPPSVASVALRAAYQSVTPAAAAASDPFSQR